MASISEQAFDASQLAVKEVARLLQRPEDLARLSSLRADYEAKQLANRSQLSYSIQSHVDAAKAGMEQLERAHVAVTSLRRTFGAIMDLCAECDQLIEHQDKIQLLSTVNTNLLRIVQDVEGISAIPTKANRARDLLNSNQLTEAYRELAELESMSRVAEVAMKARSAQDGNNTDIRDLEIYFKKVKETSSEVEAQLWRVVRDFLSLSRSNPALLVSAVRIIEMQEIVDAQASGNRDTHRKNFKEIALSQMASAVADSFGELLQKCGRFAPDGNEDEVSVDDILAVADDRLGELADVYDYVLPCFPAEYSVFDDIWQAYHRQFSAMLNMIGSVSDQLSNSDILKVVGWVTTYTDTIANLGVEEEELQFGYTNDGNTPGLGKMVDEYVVRLEQQIARWFRNIVSADIEAEPSVRDDGRLWTPGSVDFFRLLNEQVTVVLECTTGYLLYRVNCCILQQLDAYLAEQRDFVARPELSLEQRAAAVNNNLHCYEQSMEMADSLEADIDDEYKDGVDVEAVARGFLEVAKSAAVACANAVLCDVGVVELLRNMYCSAEWQQGAVTDSLGATINDYFGDLRLWVDASFFKRVAHATLEALVSKLTACLLSTTKVKITEAFISRMEEDEATISDAFTSALRSDRVAQHVQQLQDIRDLLSSDSVEEYVLSYTSLLQCNASLTPGQLEKLMQARADMSKQDIHEVMSQCRDVYVTRQREIGGGMEAHPGGSSPRGVVAGWARPPRAARLAPREGDGADTGQGGITKLKSATSKLKKAMSLKFTRPGADTL